MGSTRTRRRGVVAVYTALFMVVLLGVAAIVVDMGALYRRRIIAQRCADAAALAGAWQLAHFQAKPYADTMAKYYASLPENGGYVDGTNSAAVTVEYPAKDESGVTRNNWYRITVRRPEKTFFASSFRRNAEIAATATAIYTTLAPINIKGLGTYGTAPGPVNLSVFGPNGRYGYGDCYSTKYLNDGVSKNPDYNPKGYDFLITVPKTYKGTTLEIYDPDCYNPNGPDSGNGQVDEYRKQNGDTGTVLDATVTQYALYDDHGTPNNPDDDGLPIAIKSYGADITTDGKWVNFYTGDRSLLPNSNFRLNVVSTAGSSENGFDLRIGPTRTGSQAFDPNNGTAIAADGHLPMNFNQSGTVKIALGTLPVEAAGGTVDIRKFDTDVGAKSITYSCSSLPGYVFPAGTLSADGKFATDTLNVPASYTTAGTWYAEYQAGTGDTSVWDMSYSNAGPGRPGTIKLIR
ncbi:hypothetical protein EON83_10635 [bacterium]|nr:MAG: hypothetical protein EON83_10635 [bacterium]